ncbi:hypothetical protein B0J17DRAFT_706555 [Rhizoctonia solani]|nr:hypothetical protein B0J17DRAFT_706555 [Rhizoctonia solani]
MNEGGRNKRPPLGRRLDPLSLPRSLTPPPDYEPPLPITSPTPTNLSAVPSCRSWSTSDQLGTYKRNKSPKGARSSARRPALPPPINSNESLPSDSHNDQPLIFHLDASDDEGSELDLYEGFSDLASNTWRPFRNRGMRSLSACQPARGDKSDDGKSTYLASETPVTGYSSTNATRWNRRQNVFTLSDHSPPSRTRSPMLTCGKLMSLLSSSPASLVYSSTNLVETPEFATDPDAAPYWPRLDFRDEYRTLPSVLGKPKFSRSPPLLPAPGVSNSKGNQALDQYVSRVHVLDPELSATKDAKPGPNSKSKIGQPHQTYWWINSGYKDKPSGFRVIIIYTELGCKHNSVSPVVKPLELLDPELYSSAYAPSLQERQGRSHVSGVRGRMDNLVTADNSVGISPRTHGRGRQRDPLARPRPDTADVWAPRLDGPLGQSSSNQPSSKSLTLASRRMVVSSAPPPSANHHQVSVPQPRLTSTQSLRPTHLAPALSQRPIKPSLKCSGTVRAVEFSGTSAQDRSPRRYRIEFLPARLGHWIFTSGLPSFKGCSANFDWEPGGFGGPFDPLDFTGLGFPNNLDSMNGGTIPWFEQDPGSELLQGLELNNEPLQVYLDTIVPSANTPIPQPHYHDGGNPAVQQPTNVPSPPVPLAVNSNSSARQSEWNAGFVAGCGFANRASGGSVTHSQLRESSPEWNAGFVAGCTSTITPTPAGPESPTVLPVPTVPQSLVQDMHQQFQDQSSTSTTQTVIHSDILNDIQSITTSASSEPTPAANSDASSSSDVGQLVTPAAGRNTSARFVAMFTKESIDLTIICVYIMVRQARMPASSRVVRNRMAIKQVCADITMQSTVTRNSSFDKHKRAAKAIINDIVECDCISRAVPTLQIHLTSIVSKLLGSNNTCTPQPSDSSRSCINRTFMCAITVHFNESVPVSPPLLGSSSLHITSESGRSLEQIHQNIYSWGRGGLVYT